MLKIDEKWAKTLTEQPESGMDYQIVSIILKNGKRFDQAIHTGGNITRIRGLEGIPFKNEDIAEIIVTHDNIFP